MTAWHDDLTDDSAIAGYIALGGLGYQDDKLLLVVGTEDDLSDVVGAVTQQLAIEDDR